MACKGMVFNRGLPDYSLIYWQKVCYECLANGRILLKLVWHPRAKGMVFSCSRSSRLFTNFLTESVSKMSSWHMTEPWFPIRRSWGLIEACWSTGSKGLVTHQISLGAWLSTRMKELVSGHWGITEFFENYWRSTGFQELIQVFSEHDSNGDGVLDQQEFNGMVMSLERLPLPGSDSLPEKPNERLASKLFSEVRASKTCTCVSWAFQSLQFIFLAHSDGCLICPIVDPAK